MAMPLKINGTRIKSPTGFQIERYKITKASRVASGKMTMDVIARKLKFLFNYKVLSGAEYKTILDILDTDTAFFTLEYVENDVVKTATVYSGAITANKFRTDEGAWYWKDVTFDLIEQ